MDDPLPPQWCLHSLALSPSTIFLRFVSAFFSSQSLYNIPLLRLCFQVSTLALMIVFLSFNISELHKSAPVEKRLTYLEQQFKGASVLLHKEGILPKVGLISLTILTVFCLSRDHDGYFFWWHCLYTELWSLVMMSYWHHGPVTSVSVHLLCAVK